MPLEIPLPPVAERAAQLNERFQNDNAVSVLSHSLSDPYVGRIGMVSSFGAESVVLLHLISIMDRDLPVLFIDTEMLFAETLNYQREVAENLGLTNVQVLKASRGEIEMRDPDGLLQQVDPDACCALRKSEPLQNALPGFDAWITGRKRFQGASRQGVEFFENDNDVRIKVSPLAYWTHADLQNYTASNDLLRHPLADQGYPSIGCAPCTSPVNTGEDLRAGRWRRSPKTECGIHFTPVGEPSGREISE